MRSMLVLLLAGGFITCSCDSAPDKEASQKAARLTYMQRMTGPGAEARTYLDSYTTHKVECESGERFFCTQAKVDLAHIEWAWRQALAISEEMSQDSTLSDTDRKDAQKVAEDLQAAIARIQSAKSGKLPQL